MRRAPLLVLVMLSAPAVAAAQVAPTPAAGQITFPTVNESATDGFINAGECAGASVIALSWRVGFDEGTIASVASYQLYAANKDTTDDCPTTDQDKGDTSLRAGSVATITTEVLETMVDVEFPTSLIAARAGKGTCDATANEDIFLCIQAKDSGGNNVGTSRGKLTLSLTSPNAPTGVSASPGERALEVRWDEVEETSTTPAALSYLVDATPIGTTTDAFDPTPIHTSRRVSATDSPGLRLNGLVNGVIYSVRVFAFSDADNQSLPSAAATGIPQPVNDYWETYLAAGGREEGGCASGAAGVLALAAAAASLLLVRRRP